MDSSAPAKRARRLALAAVALLLSVFAIRAWSAVQRESFTYDEPAHLLSGYVALELHDYRFNREHPILWKMWAALPAYLRGGVPLAQGTPDWDRGREYEVASDTFFNPAHPGAAAAMAGGRFMLLLVALGLGGLLAFWAWRLGGPVAAVAAVVFFSLDPSFLGHAPLITNDVATSLAFLAVAFTVWRVGQEATLARLVLLAVACAFAVLVKFTGIAIGFFAVLLLLVRASAGTPWIILGRPRAARASRWAAAAAIGVACALFAWLALWSAYGFRYRISPDARMHTVVDAALQWEARNRDIVTTGTESAVKPGQVAALHDTLANRATLAIEHDHLLPESFIAGLLYARVRAIARPSYLAGRFFEVGVWYYFPIAFLVKTPLGTLLALAVSLGLLGALWRRRPIDGGGGSPSAWPPWDAVCLILPPGLFLAMTVAAHLNIGLRHLFPIYPFLFIAIGLACARAWRLRAGPVLAALGFAAALLAGESLIASPDYLAFFNAAAGGERGGLHWLGDSNLDWGQGLKLLAGWQAEHPGVPVQLAYFGSAPPEYYGVHAADLLEREGDVQTLRLSARTRVVAIGATVLQGIYLTGGLRAVMVRLSRTAAPVAVLGGCLYLYNAEDLARAARAGGRGGPS